jgi:hypothetical protein
MQLTGLLAKGQFSLPPGYTGSLLAKEGLSMTRRTDKTYCSLSNLQAE